MVRKTQATSSLKIFPLRQRSLLIDHPTDDRGFSLIEVVAVVLMIGVLAAIALPSWSAFVNRQKINRANDTILSAIQEAQAQAKRTKSNYSVSFRVQTVGGQEVPQYLIHQESNLSQLPSKTRWQNLSELSSSNTNKILLYTNLSSYNSNYNNKSGDSLVVNTPGSGTITFDYMGVLARKSNGNNSDTPLKVMVSLSRGTQAAGLRRCIVLETLIGGTRIAKDGSCS